MPYLVTWGDDLGPAGHGGETECAVTDAATLRAQINHLVHNTGEDPSTIRVWAATDIRVETLRVEIEIKGEDLPPAPKDD